MKRATLKKIIINLSLIVLSAICGGYLAYKGGEQVFASVWLSSISEEAYKDIRALRSLPKKNTTKTKKILCFNITGWETIYSETKYHIEKGIIPIAILKSVSFINNELIDLEINNKKIMSAQKLCE